MLKSYLLVMVAGAAGSGARLFVQEWMGRRLGEGFPWGTICVNISGCFLIGWLMALTLPGGVWPISPLWRQALAIGFLGGFTTFSSFSLQTLTLAGEGKLWQAMANIVVSLGFCLLATWLGLQLGGGLAAK